MQPLDGVLEQVRLVVHLPSPPAPLPQAGEGSETEDGKVLEQRLG